MALELTQHVTKINTRDVAGGKGGRCVELTNLPPSCASCLKTLEPQPPAALRPCLDLYRESFTFNVNTRIAVAEWSQRHS